MGRNGSESYGVSNVLAARKTAVGKTIGIMSSSPDIGRGTVSINIATSLAQRNFQVLFSSSPGERLGISCRREEKNAKTANKQFQVVDSSVQGLRVLKFTDDADKMSLRKMEEMAVLLPEKIRETYDYFIYSVKDPYIFPDRYILLNTDVFIMIVRSDATAFSNLFLQLEKLSFIPKPPKEICLVFNKTKDMTLAFEAYQNILRDAKELNIRVYFSFMGSVPYDGYRQEMADRGKQPLAYFFPDSPFSSSISLIASKIIAF